MSLGAAVAAPRAAVGAVAAAASVAVGAAAAAAAAAEMVAVSVVMLMVVVMLVVVVRASGLDVLPQCRQRLVTRLAAAWHALGLALGLGGLRSLPLRGVKSGRRIRGGIQGAGRECQLLLLQPVLLLLLVLLREQRLLLMLQL